MCVAVALFACGGESAQSYEWALPEGVDPPPVPTDNPQTAEKVELGRHLFYDTNLSLEDNRSCGICHEQAKGFTDGFPRAIGTTGELHVRNSLSLTNVGYFEKLTWSDPSQGVLETQLLLPLLGSDPIVEMGMGGREAELLDRVRAREDYVDMFALAFPEDEHPINLDNLAKSIAAFQRTIISFDSRYDQYLRGDTEVLNPSELRGMELFFGEGRCGRCHGGPNLQSPTSEDGDIQERHGYFNVGLYNLDVNGSYPEGNEGLFRSTNEASDMGRHRTPSLRNVEITRPYMHDGSVDTLEHAVEIMTSGGRVLESGPNIGDGSANPHKSELIADLDFTLEQRADLVNFLNALTDHTFLNSAALGSPYPPFVPEPPG
jgi:cytochrome c peroxidase